jgi:hypothetical protein
MRVDDEFVRRAGIEAAISLRRFVEADDLDVDDVRGRQPIPDNRFHQLAVVSQHRGLSGVETVRLGPAETEPKPQLSMPGDLYDARRRPGPVAEAACWSHARRKFFELADLRKAPLAIEAVRRIDAIFAIEREINGATAEQRLAVRHERLKPLVDELETWMRSERARLSRHADIARAIDYMRKRWPAFTPLSRRRPRLPVEQCR